jgi:hypothetical protein
MALKPIVLFEAAMTLVIITAIHDLTPQRSESHVVYQVLSPADAMAKCSAHQQAESQHTNKHPTERGKVSVRCELHFADGTTAQLAPSLLITPPPVSQ